MVMKSHIIAPDDTTMCTSRRIVPRNSVIPTECNASAQTGVVASDAAFHTMREMCGDRVMNDGTLEV